MLCVREEQREETAVEGLPSCQAATAVASIDISEPLPARRAATGDEQTIRQWPSGVAAQVDLPLFLCFISSSIAIDWALI